MMKPARMLKEVVGSLCREPVTCRYPYEKSKIAPRYRGRISFDGDLCIGCKVCVRDCPSGAIEIFQVPGEKYQFSYRSLLQQKKVQVQIDKPGKKKFRAVINLGKCLYCAQCVEACPKKALRLTADYELATLDKDQLLRCYEGPDESAEKK